MLQLDSVSAGAGSTPPILPLAALLPPLAVPQHPLLHSLLP